MEFIIGNYYKILCLVEGDYYEVDVLDEEQETWMDLDHNILPKRYQFLRLVQPLIDHLHNDVENGQYLSHYHADTRFRATSGGKKSMLSYYRIYLPLQENQRLSYEMVECISLKETYPTPLNMIMKSKLKHKCIHKGKCPHRGYDLSNVTPIDGVITCPLHSLKFREDNGELIQNEIIKF